MAFADHLTVRARHEGHDLTMAYAANPASPVRRVFDLMWLNVASRSGWLEDALQLMADDSKGSLFRLHHVPRYAVQAKDGRRVDIDVSVAEVLEAYPGEEFVMVEAVGQMPFYTHKGVAAR